jgi:4-amino-4-deoxy-L-arabinose transferase-like glycosyltransferase
MKNRFCDIWFNSWRAITLWVIAVALTTSVLFFRLGGLVPGFAQAELSTLASSSNLRRIIENPINAPYKLPQSLLQSLGIDNAVAMRGVSAIFGLLSVCLFYFILRHWFSVRPALLGTLLMATSSWFLHTARFGTPDILQLAGILAILACGLWLRFNKRRSLSVFAACASVVLSLYIPGLVWFTAAMLLWRRKIILHEFTLLPVFHVVLACLASALLIAPLIYATVRRPGLLSELAGFPNKFIGLEEIGRNLITVPQNLFISGPSNQVRWLGHLPLLDVFSIAMFALGVYYLYCHWRLDRAKMLAGIFIFGSLLISLGGSVTLTLLLPFVYIIITVGLSLMMQQWFTVFPRNPVARSLGVGLLSVALLLSIIYHTTRYFIAWPNAPATRQAYDISNQ